MSHSPSTRPDRPTSDDFKRCLQAVPSSGTSKPSTFDIKQYDGHDTVTFLFGSCLELASKPSFLITGSCSTVDTVSFDTGASQHFVPVDRGYTPYELVNPNLLQKQILEARYGTPALDLAYVPCISATATGERVPVATGERGGHPRRTIDPADQFRH